MRKRLSKRGVGQRRLEIGQPERDPNDTVTRHEGNREVASSGGAPVSDRSQDQPPPKGVKSSRKKKAYSLYDKVYREDNLWRAWERVKANQGAPGCDGVSTEQFAGKAEQEIAKRVSNCARRPTSRARYDGTPSRSLGAVIVTWASRVCATASCNRQSCKSSNRITNPSSVSDHTGSDRDGDARPPCR